MLHEFKSAPSRELDKLIERQFRNWELARQQKLEAQARESKQVEDFVALSRAVGLSGEEVAQGLHDRLNWPVFDRQILQSMAGDDEYRRRLYTNMDERDMSWLEECLHGLGADYPRNDYFHRLRETILSLARKSHAVFLGRAADLILPRSSGLRVRLTGSRDFCLDQFRKASGLPRDVAQKELDALEKDRADFVLRHFGIDAAEPTRHDLIINMERFNAKQAVDLILTGLRLRGFGP